MATKVLVPLLGEGVEEVTIIKWLKKEGEAVNELEPLLEVNTDKVDTEIPAPASGTVLKILAEEGVPAKVGSLLALIGKPGEAIDDGGSRGVRSLQTSESKAVVPQHQEMSPRRHGDALTPEPKKDVGFISPVVAKIAAEHGVNLQQVQGTGLNGRITKNDVLAFVESSHGAVDREPHRIDRPQATVISVAGDQLIK